eukprot:60642-Chlamydomonas_euryale.AAC.1
MPPLRAAGDNANEWLSQVNDVYAVPGENTGTVLARVFKGLRNEFLRKKVGHRKGVITIYICMYQGYPER